jgi:ferredoxin
MFDIFREYSTTTITFSIALAIVLNVVILLGAFNLFIGVFEFLFGRPKIKILKSKNVSTGFAFDFTWNHSKEPAKIDLLTINLFNPFGSPDQVSLVEKINPQSTSFFVDLNLGKVFEKILLAKNLNSSRVTISLSSAKDGVNFVKEMNGSDFVKEVKNASITVTEMQENEKIKDDSVASEKTEGGLDPKGFGVIHRATIADTVPGLGPQLKIATNPAFQGDFAPAGSSATEGTAAVVENFAISKVWIEPGCIVCNACEDIFPEVFEVTSDSCIIRPGAPHDDGLKIEEAAEACPVEVIKFNRA